MSMNGRVKFKNEAKGWGFLIGEDGKDYFFHCSGLKGIGFEQLTGSVEVIFETRESQKRRGEMQAFNVRLKTPSSSPHAVEFGSPAEELKHAKASESPTKKLANDSLLPGTLAPAFPNLYPPYRAVPVDVDHAIKDAPVWHHGIFGEPLFSGEILCSLNALTPLLAGNHRYKVKDADQSMLASWNFGDLLPEKHIAEPLRLADGRVVLPGTALKGMFRQSLGALLSAPMERVAEKHYTYRPNLDHGAKRQCRPAVVESVGDDEMRVKVLPKERSAVFLHGDASKRFVSMKPGTPLTGDHKDLAYEEKEKKVNRNRIVDEPGASLFLSHLLFSYKGGIDGTGKLAKAFKETAKVHGEALVPKSDYDSAIDLPVEEAVLQQYYRTQEVLADHQIGHIASSHPKSQRFDAEVVSNDIQKSKKFEEKQLVYVEVEFVGGVPIKILSIGHHYQYRWAYTSSVRTKGGELRECLQPLAEEQWPKPQKLSGARLFHGYVSSDDLPIGEGVYTKLAGRLAFNHALSLSTPEFLGDKKHGHAIPLRILGSPKGSAWEFYLEQNADQDKPATYGDLPGEDGGELAGRKFYLHQPRVQTEADIRAETLGDDMATLARFICKPGTGFRFNLRFARLRLWELGAVLAVLEPHWLTKENDPDSYAHKLGLGKPLGMGSVSTGVDILRARREAETRLSDGEALRAAAIAAFKEKMGDNLGGATVTRWLDIHRYVDRGSVAYPFKAEKETTVFNWHTNLRKKYAAWRRNDQQGAFPLMKDVLDGQHIRPGKPATVTDKKD